MRPMAQHNWILVVLIASLVAVLSIPSARGAVDMFLKIEGVPGESTKADHRDWIEILSYSHGVSQPASGALASGGARSAGRADHSDFSIVKTLDRATPKLNLYCCNGTHIPKVEFELAEPSGDKRVFFKITLYDVIVTSVKPTGSAASDRPTEEVTLNYSRITWQYTLFGPGDPTHYEAEWDVGQNTGN